MITDKSGRNKITQSAWHKENYFDIPSYRETNAPDTRKTSR